MKSRRTRAFDTGLWVLNVFFPLPVRWHVFEHVLCAETMPTVMADEVFFLFGHSQVATPLTSERFVASITSIANDYILQLSQSSGCW
jgi:hypothetical protein